MLAATGIAVGVTALIIVLGVMGGLQKGYIDSILDISSFHLREEVPPDFPSDSLESIRALPGVASVVAFKETHVLALGPSGQALTLYLRAFQDGAERFDPSLVKALGIAEGGELPQEGSIVLGKEAAASLGADIGTPIDFFGIRQSEDEGVVPVRSSMPVGNIFDSGYYEFDSTMGFVPLESPEGLMDAFASVSTVLGIKLDDRYDDYRMAKEIQALLPEDAGTVQSWRDYNRSFFGALRTEKSVMMILISLIFVVVGINIFHAMRRTIAAKMSDIAVLKACGAADIDIRRIFILDGLSIGVIGAAAGVIRFLASIFQGLGLASSGSDYRLFSPVYYYIEKIPVSISTGELLFIAATAIASTGLAALVAARRVSEAKPSEVFRNE
jgi:lipoprotein-releasing system permease protein